MDTWPTTHPLPVFFEFFFIYMAPKGLHKYVLHKNDDPSTTLVRKSVIWSNIHIEVNAFNSTNTSSWEAEMS